MPSMFSHSRRTTPALPDLGTQVKQGLCRFTIGQKIALGYVVTLGIALSGVMAGILIGNYYHYQAREQQAKVKADFRLVAALKFNLANAQIHERTLTALLQAFKSGSIQKKAFYESFQEEGDEVREYAEAANRLWSNLKQTYENAAIAKTSINPSSFQALLKQHDGLTEAYVQQLNTWIPKMIAGEKQSPDPAVLQKMMIQLDQHTLSPKFHGFVESVEELFEVLLKEEEVAERQLDRAEQIGTQIITLSLVLSSAIAILLALLTTWAIAHPIQTATRVAQRVTEEDNFDLQAPITTKDEVGILTTSLNNLIQRVKHLLIEQKAAETRLIQSEKMSSLGQLVAGVAHEINNPINFIHGNLSHAQAYTQDLMQLLQRYQHHYPTPHTDIQTEIEVVDLDFVMQDLPKLLRSMQVGTERIRGIALSLRNFSRLDEAEFKVADLHEGIESTLMILQSRLKARSDHPGIQVQRDFGELPLVECYPGQLNQVFINLLANAIDALEDNDSRRTIEAMQANPSVIRIWTEVIPRQRVAIHIADNGIGMGELVRARLFEPFFTTKSVGRGTGLGLSISYQIVVENHGGKLSCYSTPGQGTEFVVEVPIKQCSPKLAC
ncbi:MAG: ATP-binding protein [Leptolyngbyaceae cyanobacterium bins.302]|nr:ATP-binding protein [Leptolyngbyaceae cyanobacterium bins.302]